MTMSSTRWRCAASTFTAALALCAGAACPATPPVKEPDAQERRTFTTNYADGIVVPRLTDFAARAATLRDASAALADAGGTAGVLRDEARAAWRDAMAVWQQLEMVQLGPAGTPPGVTGGEGLRPRLYAWPLMNLCAVDAQLLSNEFSADGWVETRQPNILGLAAMEYVLFVDSPANICPATSAMNTDGSWDALGTAEVSARRARYAAVLGADVAAKAVVMEDAWRREGGFAAQLRTAGESGSSFPTAQQALDEVYAALFAVELQTKDKKLAIPAGLHVDCPAESCPDKAESRFSRTSLENLAANLAMVRVVLLGIDAAGRDATGFDDLLADRGQEALATEMTMSLDAAIAAVAAFEGTIEDALVTEPARVRALYDAVKGFTDELKSTFPTALGLRIPDEGAGDND